MTISSIDCSWPSQCMLRAVISCDHCAAQSKSDELCRNTCDLQGPLHQPLEADLLLLRLP